MSQNDFTIADGAGIDVRQDIEAALQALASCSLGTSAPSTTYPGLLWADTTNALLKQRNSADSAWITLGQLDAAFLGLIPAGGSTGQVLSKASGTDLDTAWTAPAIGYEAATVLTSTTAIVGTDRGKWYRTEITAADITLTLPDATALPSGWFATIHNYWFSTKNALLDAGSGKLIQNLGDSAQTLTLTPGQLVRLICDGAGNWLVDSDFWRVTGAIKVKAGGAVRVLGPANNTAQKLTFTITSSADATPQAHGLGRQPLYLDAYLVCTATDAGRAVGDRIKLPPPNDTTHGCSIYTSSTAIAVSFGSATSVFQLWTAGALVNLTNSKWTLEVYYD